MLMMRKPARQKYFLFAALVSGLASALLLGRGFRVSEIPNGGVNTCRNCHLSPTGGLRNDFGDTIEKSFLSVPGPNGHVLWGADLARRDSDGDAATNGEELQDAEGAWKIGDPAPGDRAAVTIPGDAASYPMTTFVAQLHGSNVAPPIVSRARGNLIATLQDTTLELTGEFSLLNEEPPSNVFENATLHFKVIGQDSANAMTLRPALHADRRGGAFEAAHNTFALTREQVQALQTRHGVLIMASTAFPTGELAGTLTPQAEQFFRVYLAGANTEPAGNSPASGALLAELRGDLLTLSGAFENLTDDFFVDLEGGAHLKNGAAGQEGEFVLALEALLNEDARGGVFFAQQNQFQLAPEQVAALSERKLHVNILSNAFPFGELRGQLAPLAESYFLARLAGAHQAVPVATSAQGLVLVELSGAQLTLTGSFYNLSSALSNTTASAALYFGDAGEEGAMTIALDPQLETDRRSGIFEARGNTFTLIAEQLRALKTGGLYLNLLTAKYPAGELRGQILPEANAFFSANLSANNLVSPVASSGRGTCFASLTGPRLTVSGSFNALHAAFNPNLAAMQRGAVDENGPAEIMLAAISSPDSASGVFELRDNTFTLTDEQAVALHEGKFYINIPSAAFPGGELRGQLLPVPNHFPNFPALLSPEEGAAFSLEDTGCAALEITWTHSNDPDGNALVYLWQLLADTTAPGFIINMSAGASAALNVPLSELDSLLAQAGHENEKRIELYHRVYASDGSLQSASAFRAIIFTRTQTSVSASENLPLTHALLSNHPNPFTTTTQIAFTLPRAEHVRLEIYNTLGQRVRTLSAENFPRGRHERTWNGRDDIGRLVPAGLYFCRVQTERFQRVRRLLLLQ